MDGRMNGNNRLNSQANFFGEKCSLPSGSHLFSQIISLLLNLFTRCPPLLLCLWLLLRLLLLQVFDLNDLL